MNFNGAEIPAWGMFALAVIYIAFQFVLKWQETQAKKAQQREEESKPPQSKEPDAPTAKLLREHDLALKEISKQLGAVTSALGGITNVLTVLSQQTNELHQIHLGPRALDENNRPKWWSDHELMMRIEGAVNEMNHRMTRLELDMRMSTRRSSKDSVRGLSRADIEREREKG